MTRIRCQRCGEEIGPRQVLDIDDELEQKGGAVSEARELCSGCRRAAMREELLAFLEDGPKPQRQLANWVACGLHTVGRELRAMQRLGLVKRLGSRRRWALAKAKPRPSGRPRKNAARRAPVAVEPRSRGAKGAGHRGQAVAAPRSARGAAFIDRMNAAADIDRTLGIDDRKIGTAVCHACGRRFFPGRDDQRCCSAACAASPRPPSTTTRIIDGVEFEALSIGKHELSRWPDGGGSSLSGSDLRWDVSNEF